MKRTLLLIALVGALTLAASLAQAGPLQHRFHRQHDRIAQGVACGQLTPREAHRLRMGERAIASERREYMEDGRMGPRERMHLRHDMNRESRQIWRLRHNRHQRDMD